METITQEQDITVGYIAASSFPDGVMEAHERLHELLPGTDRRFYGLSRPEDNGGIVYRAAAEMGEAEAGSMGLDTVVLKKGEYLGKTVHNYMQQSAAIGSTFREILEQPGLDPQGYCVEWYISDKEVQCSVRKEG